MGEAGAENKAGRPNSQGLCLMELPCQWKRQQQPPDRENPTQAGGQPDQVPEDRERGDSKAPRLDT